MDILDPKSWLSLTELPRSGLELSMLLPSAPFLATTPHGDGHPVIVMPGFLADDDSTLLLRRYLEFLGYDTHPWAFGRNLGSFKMGGYEALVKSVLAIYRESSRKVSLVGWSLGGVHAMAVAYRAGYAVRQVVTIGSPISTVPNASNNDEDMTSIYDALKTAANSINAVPSMMSNASPWQNYLLKLDAKMPISAIYSKLDGVVPWQRAKVAPAARRENIEVWSSHLGLGVNPAVLLAIADRLGLEENKFVPFDRSGWRAPIYPDPGDE